MAGLRAHRHGYSQLDLLVLATLLALVLLLLWGDTPARSVLVG